jgi:hypothetical protein
MSSAESPRFDATAAAQQMLELEVQAGQPSVPAQQSTTRMVVQEPGLPSGQLPGLLTEFLLARRGPVLAQVAYDGQSQPTPPRLHPD